MSDWQRKELLDAAETVLAATKYVEPVSVEDCKHCDPDVGFICPMCGLVGSARYLANWVLNNKE